MTDIKKGICINVGNCKTADAKTPLEIPVSADFVCLECNKDLVEVVKKTPILGGVIIRIAAIILAGLTGGFFIYQNSGKKKQITEQVVPPLAPATKKPPTGSIQREQNDANVPETQPAKTATPPLPSASQPTITQPPAPSTKTRHPDVGNYARFQENEGQSSDNTMDGTMIFHSRHIIASNDPDQRVAEPGDKVVGRWIKGQLSNGNWYDSKGNLKGKLYLGTGE